MFQTYLDFVVERHRIWEMRQLGIPAPWTQDPILQTNKFCNVFRLLDHGSQFVARDLLGDPELPGEEVLLRAYLYRMTNIPDAFETFRIEHGHYPFTEDVHAGRWLATLQGIRERRGRIFGSAYRIQLGKENAGIEKHVWIDQTARDYFGEKAPYRLWPIFSETETLEGRVAVLSTLPRIANFLAMQIATDYGYHPAGGDVENEWIVAGLGAVRGIRRLSADADTTDYIHFARERVLELDDCPTIPLADGSRRGPSLMDIQNTFCEFDKYMRHLGKEVRPRRYIPAHEGVQPEPFVPSHWN